MFTCFKHACFFKIGTLRNESESKDDGNCEKYSFSFSFSVLYHHPRAAEYIGYEFNMLEQ